MMTHVDALIEIHAPPDEIWALVGDPARSGEWVPAFEGVEVVDRSDQGRYYTCELTEAPGFPFFLSCYRATLSVHGDGARSRVRWDAEFEAESPDGGAELAAMFGEISRQGLESLRAQIESLAVV